MIDEAVERLLALDALLIFEVLQPVINLHRYQKYNKQYDGGAHRIAWGFLRLSGPGGKPLMGEGQRSLPGIAYCLSHTLTSSHPLYCRFHTQGRLQLQLYDYKTSIGILGQGAKPPPGHSAHTPFYAFSSWQVGG